MSNESINKHYTEYYLKKNYTNMYPTEFVVRTFLSFYPNLHMDKLSKGDKVIDVSCGDGRNTLFLMEQGYDVYGTEITQPIVDAAQTRLDFLAQERGLNKAKISVGRNNSLPYQDEFADTLLACYCAYYLDDGSEFEDTLREYSRVLKKDGYLIVSLLENGYITQGGDDKGDGTIIVRNDPYNNRNGCCLKVFRSIQEIQSAFSECFYNFSFGMEQSDWYGISQKVNWCVCQKR